MSPQERLVLKRMKENISKTKLSNGCIQYVVKYLFNSDPVITFDPKLSNFVEANKQACRNYKKILLGEQGKEVVKKLLRRDVEDDHFRVLNIQETKYILDAPHSFSYQTTAFKESSLTTLVTHQMYQKSLKIP